MWASFACDVTKDRGYNETEAAVANRVQRYGCDTLIEAMSRRYAREGEQMNTRLSSTLVVFAYRMVMELGVWT